MDEKLFTAEEVAPLAGFKDKNQVRVYIHRFRARGILIGIRRGRDWFLSSSDIEILKNRSHERGRPAE
jgi:DNA-binding transcriptional regulator PaaX